MNQINFKHYFYNKTETKKINIKINIFKKYEAFISKIQEIFQLKN